MWFIDEGLGGVLRPGGKSKTVQHKSYSGFDYDEAKRTIDFLRHEYRPERLLVFGSAAKNNANKYSDLDVLMVVSDYEALIPVKGSFGERSASVLDDLDRYGYRLPVDIIVFTSSEFEEEMECPSMFMKEISSYWKQVA